MMCDVNDSGLRRSVSESEREKVKCVTGVQQQQPHIRLSHRERPTREWEQARGTRRGIGERSESRVDSRCHSRSPLFLYLKPTRERERERDGGRLTPAA